MVLGYGLAVQGVVVDMVAEQGVTDEQLYATAFAAGYTLPLVVAVAGIALAYAYGRMPQDGVPQLILIGFVLAASGFVSHFVGLGLAPDMPLSMVAGPPYVSVPLTAIMAYVSAYGVPLAICAVAIGLSTALQILKWSGFDG